MPGMPPVMLSDTSPVTSPVPARRLLVAAAAAANIDVRHASASPEPLRQTALLSLGAGGPNESPERCPGDGERRDLGERRILGERRWLSGVRGGVWAKVTVCWTGGRGKSVISSGDPAGSAGYGKDGAWGTSVKVGERDTGVGAGVGSGVGGGVGSGVFWGVGLSPASLDAFS